jgi:hypothetical protein
LSGAGRSIFQRGVINSGRIYLRKGDAMRTWEEQYEMLMKHRTELWKEILENRIRQGFDIDHPRAGPEVEAVARQKKEWDELTDKLEKERLDQERTRNMP